MLASVTHILPSTRIRRERLLPVPGKVVVRKGQKVDALDTVAEANLFPEHIILEVARGLGLPTAKADEHTQVKAGSQVSAGDVLAGPVGLTRRVVRSPRNGWVIVVGNGQILLQVQKDPFAVKAGFPGEVMELIPDRGAIIETSGALIQGVWGNGHINFGLISVLADDPLQPFTQNSLDVSLRGSMVAAGFCGSSEVLTAAAELPVRGLILAGLDPLLVPVAERMSFPIIVLEGFGNLPMNKMTRQLLSANERHEVALNAEPWDRYTGTRPEIIIPLAEVGATPAPRDMAYLAPGKLVRVASSAYMGRAGTVVEIRRSVTFPSGLRGPAAEIRFENNESAWLPLSNLEILD